jgi:hypothetical protein
MLAGMSPDEARQMVTGFGGDIASLDLTKEQQKRWTDFRDQMTRAGHEIDATLSRGLLNLTPGIERMSKAFVHIAEDIFNPKSPIPGILKKVGEGFSEFAKTLSSGETLSEIRKFTSDVANIIRNIEGLTAKSWSELAAMALRGAGAIAGQAVAPSQLNAGEDERYRQAHPGWTPDQPRDPNWRPAVPPGPSAVQPQDRGKPILGPGKALEFGPQGRSRGSTGHDRPSGGHMVPGTAQTGAAPPGTPWNHAMASRAVDNALPKIGETINNDDIQTYLRTGGHPDPGKAAWCAMFVGASLTKAGIKDSGSNVATSYETWGRAVDPRLGVERGDVLVKTRGHRPGEVGGHVGLLTGETRFVHGREQVQMIAGNAGNKPHRVATTWETVGGTNMIRRADSIRHHSDLLNRHRESLDAAHGRTPPVDVHDHTGGAVNITVAQ